MYAIRSYYENYLNFDGFVVLHGSDTMSYSASALSFMLENLTKPVIFTGSQLPIGDLRTDAKENLITAIQIASLQENVITSYSIHYTKLYDKNMGAYGFMLMNFNLVKFRLASPKAYSAPAAGSYERSKKRQANAIAMVFDKDLFN